MKPSQYIVWLITVIFQGYPLTTEFNNEAWFMFHIKISLIFPISFLFLLLLPLNWGNMKGCIFEMLRQTSVKYWDLVSVRLTSDSLNEFRKIVHCDLSILIVEIWLNIYLNQNTIMNDWHSFILCHLLKGEHPFSLKRKLKTEN